jgi:gamma-glutamylcyclotransferase (GGCT)/AIG2-like uncharacterized protein YtfP
MDRMAMAVRCPGSSPIGVARLPRHRFIIMRDGFASVVRDQRATVHGVLWNLALADIPVLDRFEDIAHRLYTKASQPVLTEVGSKRALVYFGTSAEVGKARPGYLESLLASAEYWGLPPAYEAEMARFLSSSPTRTEAAPAGRAANQWRWTP